MSPKKKRSKSSFFLSKSSPRKTPEKQKQKPKKKNLNKIVEILSQTQQAKSGKKKQEEATSVEMMSKEQKVKSMDKPKKKTKCGTCPNCIKANCGSCTNCQDMKMFGGPGKSKQSCKMRKCLLFGSSLKNSSISALAASSTSVLVRVFIIFSIVSLLISSFSGLSVIKKSQEESILSFTSHCFTLTCQCFYSFN
jgi:hypothetical protein